MEEASEAESVELVPDSTVVGELLSARGPPLLRKQEFEDVGTGSKIPKIDSPKKTYPPFSVGRVFEHNDEELPEPEPGTEDIFWEDTYSEIGDSEEEQERFLPSKTRTQDHQRFLRNNLRSLTARQWSRRSTASQR